jgi:competence ComEA-like helix-hairpin-helix protein
MMSQMKRTSIVFTLIALTFLSCRSHEEVSNINSSSQKAVEPTSISQSEPQKPCVNLNTATAEELKELPGIGDVMARRVIDYREGHGRFRRPEEIIIVEGFSEKKYRAIAGMICVE